VWHGIKIRAILERIDEQEATGWGGKRRRAGRKPLLPEERRDCRITINVTDADEASLRLAAGSKEKVTGWARAVLLRAAARSRREQRRRRRA
jgi:hypothetical protein